MKNKRIVFMGTADFSEAVLKMLIEEQYNIVAVVSQPDRPVGRKKELKPTLVKQVALAHNIPCIQPERIKTDYQCVLDYEPELIITAAYGQIVPNAVLDYPKLGCINVHTSLLPKLRGGAPVHHAIIDGHDKTGVTIMYMAEKMDAGDMISRIETPIDDEVTVGELYERLTHLGAKLLKDTLPDFLSGNFTAEKQNEEEVTFAPTIKREEEHILFNKTVVEVSRHVRGLNPWPAGFATYQGQNVKILSGHITTEKTTKQPGTIIKADKTGIYVACTDGVYCLDEIQVPGKKRMCVRDYMNGSNIFVVDSCFE